MKNPASCQERGGAGGSDYLARSVRRHPHRSSERENKYAYKYEYVAEHGHSCGHRECGVLLSGDVRGVGHVV